MPLTRVEREVTPVRGAPAVKKAPAAAPEKPPAGGFGVGL